MNAYYNSNGTWTQLSSLAVGVTPDEFIKKAEVSGNELTLTKQDDTTVSYEPDLSSKQDILTAGSGISIDSATDTISIDNTVVTKSMFILNGTELIITMP